LINIGSAAVFSAIVSLTVAGFFGSCLVPFTLFMPKRVCCQLHLTPGPRTLGRFGPWVNGVAIIWSMLMMMFSFWPASVLVTAITMN
jgi:choline transport protein